MCSMYDPQTEFSDVQTNYNANLKFCTKFGKVV